MVRCVVFVVLCTVNMLKNKYIYIVKNVTPAEKLAQLNDASLLVKRREAREARLGYGWTSLSKAIKAVFQLLGYFRQ